MALGQLKRLNNKENTHQPRLNRTLLLVTYSVLALVAVFWVPTLFPVQPAVSDSYLFGYNNWVGILLLLALLAGAALLLKKADFSLEPLTTSSSIPRRTLYLFLVGGLAVCGFMYLAALRYHGFGESGYFIDRLQQMHDGRVLYKNLWFDYGAALIYPEVWLMDLGLRSTSAYYLFWALNVLAGIVMLYAAINLIDFPSNKKREIFSLLTLTSFASILSMGVNYTLFRFAPLLLFSVIIYRTFAARRPQPSLLFASVQILLFTAILLLISPEIAVSLAAGSLLYLAIYTRPISLSRLICFAALLASLASLMWFANTMGVLDSIKRRGGGFNFPIVPAPHILLCATAILLVACMALRHIGSNRLGDVTLFVAATALPMIASALGRCDPGHVFFNGCGILLVASLYASRLPIWRSYRLAFLLLMVMPNLAAALALYHQMVSSDLYVYLPRSRPLLSNLVEKLGNGDVTRARLETFRLATASRDTFNVPALYPHATGQILAPFGYFPGNAGDFAPHTIHTGRYYGLTVFTPEQIRNKIQELRESKSQILLPIHFATQCDVNPTQELHLMRMEWLFSYKPRVRNPESIAEPLCTYIATHYRLIDPPTPQRLNYGLWSPIE